MKLFCILLTLFSHQVLAQQLPVHGPSQQQIEAMALHNSQLASFEKKMGILGNRSSAQVLPFAEYQPTGYVVFSDDDFYGIAEPMKAAIAKNLPAGVTLLVYTDSSDKQYQKDLFQNYAKYLPASQLRVIQVPSNGSNNFWTRDNLPLPVWENSQFSLVDAKYYYNFEPDSFFKSLFNVTMSSHKYFYEGGNFIANAKGDCLVVNRKKAYPGGTSDTASIPDDIFKSLYGCKTLTRFKHLKGIGHADEVVKFMSDDTVITDTQEYATILQKAGFNVVLLPEADLDYETYINSLQVNDTVFVPTFGEANDQVALNSYKKLGLKVVAIPTRELATQGQGGIHCITMNYPPAPIRKMAEILNGQVLQ